jgi:hypothetical protein
MLAYFIYPIFTCRTYTQSCSKVTPEIAPLVASYKKDVQGNINEGFRLKWELILKLDPYVRKLSSSVNTFKDKVDDLVVKYGEVTEELESLKVCKFNQATFTEVS